MHRHEENHLDFWNKLFCDLINCFQLGKERPNNRRLFPTSSSMEWSTSQAIVAEQRVLPDKLSYSTEAPAWSYRLFNSNLAWQENETFYLKAALY